MTTREELKEMSRKIGAAVHEGAGDFHDVADALAEGYAAEGMGGDHNPDQWHLLRMAALNELASTSRRLLPELVQEGRMCGASWSAIGEALDISKQAAQQRYGKLEITYNAGPDSVKATVEQIVRNDRHTARLLL